mmetsp:Transcript_54690/g.65933  ORF Transcript_54690/g.65933 Transcript_54690/m.65933 type:complete len:185 (-) Transcript_54690:759-1313(-)
MTLMHAPYFASDYVSVATNNLPAATGHPHIPDNARVNDNVTNNTVGFTTAAYDGDDMMKYDMTNNNIMTTAPTAHHASEDNVTDEYHDTPTHAMTTDVLAIDDGVTFDTIVQDAEELAEDDDTTDKDTIARDANKPDNTVHAINTSETNNAIDPTPNDNVMNKANFDGATASVTGTGVNDDYST